MERLQANEGFSTCNSCNITLKGYTSNPFGPSISRILFSISFFVRMVKVDTVQDIPLQNEAKGNSFIGTCIFFYRRNIIQFASGIKVISLIWRGYLHVLIKFKMFRTQHYFSKKKTNKPSLPPDDHMILWNHHVILLTNIAHNCIVIPYNYTLLPDCPTVPTL